MSKRKSGGGKPADPRTPRTPASPKKPAAKVEVPTSDALKSDASAVPSAMLADSATAKPPTRATSEASAPAPLGKPIRISDLKVPPLPQLDTQRDNRAVTVAPSKRGTSASRARPSRPPAPPSEPSSAASTPAATKSPTPPTTSPSNTAPSAEEAAPLPPTSAQATVRSQPEVVAPVAETALAAADTPPDADAITRDRPDAAVTVAPPSKQARASEPRPQPEQATRADDIERAASDEAEAPAGDRGDRRPRTETEAAPLRSPTPPSAATRATDDVVPFSARPSPTNGLHHANGAEHSAVSDEELWGGEGSDEDTPSGNQVSPVPAFAVEGPLSEAHRDEPAARLTRSSSGDRAREAADFGTSQSLLSTDYYFRQYGAHGLRSMAAEVDDFGFDPHVDGKVRPALELLCKRYFRVELAGVEHVPQHGRALLVANRSGALPWDGLVLRTALRMSRPELSPLRWLAEDSVIHYPFMGVFMNRLGAVRACPENAERLLAQDRLVAVFPEGAQGSRKLFRDRYRLQRFGRGGYVKLALKFGVPILPTAIVGAEETNPVLGRSRLLGRFFGSDSAPITPTFPWLGLAGLLPAPVRWRIVVGQPIDLSSYGPESADDALVVHRLNEQIRSALQTLVDDGKQQRGSALFG